MNPRTVKTLLLLLAPLFCLAQKETSNWHFWSNNGVKFSNGSLVNQTGMPGYSLSDSAGNVLFATTGNAVYDKNGTLMAGSAPLNLAGTPNILSVRKPGSQSVYYIFFAANIFNNFYTQLRYHEIDLAQNGGLGQVTTFNALLRDSVSFAFSLVRKEQTSEFWVVTHKPFTKDYTASLVTSTSLNANTVVSSPGAHPEATDYLLYDLRPSHDGKRIAITSKKSNSNLFGSHTAFIEVYDFNSTTGVLTYYVKTGSTVNAYFSSFWQVEFSPDNRLLYELNTIEAVGLQPCSLFSSTITQYNLCYNNISDFSRNVTYSHYMFFCNPGNLVLGRMQMGPDKKIYFPQTRTNQLTRIEYPNRIGTSGKPSFNVHTLTGTASYDLPAYYHYYTEKAVKNNIRYNGGCFPAPQRFEVTNDTIAAIQWNFGDAASGAANTSTLLKPEHVFTAPGYYTVTAKVFNTAGQLLETLTELIEIKDNTRRLLSGYPTDTVICGGGEVKLKLNVVNGIFRWYRKYETGTFLTDVMDSISIRETGTYYVEMHQNDCDGCIMRDSINLTVLPSPYVELGFDRNLCAGDSILLSVQTGAKYIWSTGDTTSFIWAKQGGKYWVRAEFNNNGCPQSDTVTLTQVSGVQFAFPPDTTLCSNQTMVLRPGVSNAIYNWHNGSLADTFLVTLPGQYWVKIFNNFGCMKRDTINVSYVNAANVSLGTDTSLCNGDSLRLQLNIPNATFLWSTGETSSSIVVRNSGDYWVRVNNSLCTAADTIKVTFYPKPVINLGIDTSLCEGQKLVLRTGIANAKYLWSNGSAADTLLVSQPGLYWAQVTRNGCSSRDSIMVNYKTLPPLNLGKDTSICVNATLLLNATNPTIIQYTWHDNSNQPTYLVQQPGTYSVTVRGSNGCFNKDSIAVQHTALPSFTLGKDTSLCEQQTILLSPNLSNAQYNWNTGSIANSIVVSQPGWYWVDVKQNGCAKRDSIQVLYKPLPIVNLGIDTTLCEGASKQLNAFNANATYLWQDNSTNSTLLTSQPGKYYVTVNLQGCKSSDSIQVNYQYKPVFSLGADRQLCTGQQLQLDPVIRSGNFSWQNGSTFPVQTVTQPGTYQLTVTNQCGSKTDEVNIVKGLCRLVMPNAFTPNNDRTNNLFRVKNPEYIKTFSMTVYNRWGQIIFQTTDPYKGWDGTYKNLPQPVGNYLWLISLTDFDGNKESAKGNVLLLR
jgi:gliding motility-associated-like protein